MTLERSAIRQLLKVAPELRAELHSVLLRDDDYVAPGKPVCAWDDKEAREAVVDALAKDANAAIECLEERTLTDEVGEALKHLQSVKENVSNVDRLAQRDGVGVDENWT